MAQQKKKTHFTSTRSKSERVRTKLVETVAVQGQHHDTRLLVRPTRVQACSSIYLPWPQRLEFQPLNNSPRKQDTSVLTAGAVLTLTRGVNQHEEGRLEDHPSGDLFIYFGLDCSRNERAFLRREIIDAESASSFSGKDFVKQWTFWARCVAYAEPGQTTYGGFPRVARKEKRNNRESANCFVTFHFLLYNIFLIF
jgi:hypothetical protein